MKVSVQDEGKRWNKSSDTKDPQSPVFVSVCLCVCEYYITRKPHLDQRHLKHLSHLDNKERTKNRNAKMLLKETVHHKSKSQLH